MISNLGIDLNHDVDLPANMPSLGITFAIHKVSQGASYQDPKWKARTTIFQLASIPLAGYHFVDSSMIDQQVTNFLSALGETPRQSVIDWEDIPGSTANEDQAELMAAEIKDATGIWPIVYGSDRIRESRAYRTKSPILQHCPLWLAEPVRGLGPLPADYRSTFTSATWPIITILQYSADTPGYHQPTFASSVLIGVDYNQADLNYIATWP